MQKKKKFFFICAIICIFTFSIITLNNNLKNVSVETNAFTLSNQKMGWGIKREKNHKQPDLGSTNLRIIQKYDGLAMGNNEDKYVYLTFDNGYEAGYTSKILDVLKEVNVKAAFFITAHYLNTASELVERMINEGHIIGNQFPTLLMDL